MASRTTTGGRGAAARTRPATPTARSDGRREITEQRIVAAFGRIVARDGLYQVRVNKLMREAGVGKKQLYQYFGDLSGVARAWTAAGMPAPATPRADSRRHPRAGSRVTRLTQLLRDYAEALRSNPAIFASVHAELCDRRDLSQPFDELRAKLLQEQVTFFLENPLMRNEDYTALYSVLYAAINYLALRARFAPAFNGLDLAGRPGWSAALGMIDTVAALSESGLRRRSAQRLRPQPAGAGGTGRARRGKGP